MNCANYRNEYIFLHFMFQWLRTWILPESTGFTSSRIHRNLARLARDGNPIGNAVEIHELTTGCKLEKHLYGRLHTKNSTLKGLKRSKRSISSLTRKEGKFVYNYFWGNTTSALRHSFNKNHIFYIFHSTNFKNTL